MKRQKSFLTCIFNERGEDFLRDILYVGEKILTNRRLANLLQISCSQLWLLYYRYGIKEKRHTQKKR